MMQISSETLRFIEENIRADVRSLALQAKKYPQVDMAMAVVQIAGRQIGSRKPIMWNAKPSFANWLIIISRC